MDGRQAQATRRPFVGRRVELEAIDGFRRRLAPGRTGDRLDRRSGGDGQIGPARVRGRPCRPGALLTATGDEAESALPYGLVDQLVAALPADLLAQYPLVGPGARSARRPDGGGRRSPRRARRGPRRRSLLVVVDDVQWADDLSVRTLVFVLRRLRHDRVVVLLGVRTRPRSARRRGRRGGRPAVGTHARLGARRTPAPAHGARAGRAVRAGRGLGRPLGSTGTAERLWARTRGHPLYARTLLEELSPEVLAATTTDVLPAPRSLAAVVLVRLSRRAPPGRRSSWPPRCSASRAPSRTRPRWRGPPVRPVDDPAAALDEGSGWPAHRARGPTGRRRRVRPPAAAGRGLRRPTAGATPGPAPGGRRARPGPRRPAPPDRRRRGSRPGARRGPRRLASTPRRRLPPRRRRPAARRRRPVDGPRRPRAPTFHAVEGLLAAGEIGRAGAFEVKSRRPARARSATGCSDGSPCSAARFSRARPLLDAAARDADRARAIATADLALLTVLQGHPARAVELATACFADPANGPLVRQPAGFALILGLAAAGRGRTPAGSSTSPPVPRGRTPLYADALVVQAILAASADDDAVAESDLDEALRLARTGAPGGSPRRLGLSRDGPRPHRRGRRPRRGGARRPAPRATPGRGSPS